MSKTLPTELKKQNGATLAMSLLILSLAMVSAVTLTRVILGEVRMTINTVNSLTAFYAADSAIEQGLYYVKYSKEERDYTQLFTYLDGSTVDIGSQGSAEFLEVTTDVPIGVPNFVFYDITTSSPAHIDITDFVGDISGINWDPAYVAGYEYSYDLRWGIDDCFPSHASDRLEITTYSLTDNFLTTNTDKDVVVCNCSDSDACDNLPPLNKQIISNNSFYRFSLRPLDSTVASSSLTLFFKTSGPAVWQRLGISSDISITVEGVYKNAKHKMKVEIPTASSVFDLFSYVIFSEEELRKDF